MAKTGAAPPVAVEAGVVRRLARSAPSPVTPGIHIRCASGRYEALVLWAGGAMRLEAGTKLSAAGVRIGGEACWMMQQ